MSLLLAANMTLICVSLIRPLLYRLLTMYTQLRRAGGSELLSRFTEENVIVLHSRASGNTIRFREGEVEGSGGHGALGKIMQSITHSDFKMFCFTLRRAAQFTVRIKAPGVVALQNKKDPKNWLRIMDDKLNSKVVDYVIKHNDIPFLYPIKGKWWITV